MSNAYDAYCYAYRTPLALPLIIAAPLGGARALCLGRLVFCRGDVLASQIAHKIEGRLV